MTLSSILSPQVIALDLAATARDAAFAELLDTVVAAHPQINKEKILTALKEREAKGETEIMPGVGVPHARCTDLQEMVGAIGISKKGIMYHENDAPVRVIILVLLGTGHAQLHLQLLKDIAFVLKHPYFVETLLAQPTAEAVLETINSFELYTDGR